MKKIKSLSFGISMVWREGKDHVTDCHFCVTNLQSMLILILYGGILICLIYCNTKETISAM